MHVKLRLFKKLVSVKLTLFFDLKQISLFMQK